TLADHLAGTRSYVEDLASYARRLKAEAAGQSATPECDERVAAVTLGRQAVLPVASGEVMAVAHAQGTGRATLRSASPPYGEASPKRRRRPSGLILLHR